MLVTISIINFNYGRFLECALESAFKQAATGIEIEILVVDDGSTDCSDSILERFHGKPHLRISKTTNKGFGASLERAIIEAHGEWVLLMDADDWFADNKLSRIAHGFTDRHHFITNENYFVDVNGATSGKMGSAGNTSTIAVKRKYACDLLPVDDESAFHILDYCGFGYHVKEALTYHRIHDESMASNSVAEYARRRLRYTNVKNKVQAWEEKRPSWFDKSKILHVVRTYDAMATFCSMEVSIWQRRRLSAFKNACYYIVTQIRCGTLSLRQVIKLFGRALLLRPLPTRSVMHL